MNDRVTRGRHCLYQISVNYIPRARKGDLYIVIVKDKMNELVGTGENLNPAQAFRDALEDGKIDIGFIQSDDPANWD